MKTQKTKTEKQFDVRIQFDVRLYPMELPSSVAESVMWKSIEDGLKMSLFLKTQVIEKELYKQAEVALLNLEKFEKVEG